MEIGEFLIGKLSAQDREDFHCPLEILDSKQLQPVFKRFTR
jgi:hypothetical protein